MNFCWLNEVSGAYAHSVQFNWLQEVAGIYLGC
jgi:hypothetical protein